MAYFGDAGDNFTRVLTGMSAIIYRAPNNTSVTINQQVTGNDIRGKIIGVIGIGRIGVEVTRMCRLAYHIYVLAYDPFVTDAWATAVGARRVETLDELLKASDFVSLHCPLAPQSQDLIGEKEFKSMKDSAYLVNTARGGIVNEPALLAALDAGWFQGAALDVLEVGPSSQTINC